MAMKCPQGHTLPNKANNLSCRPDICGADIGRGKRPIELPEGNLPPAQALAKAEAMELLIPTPEFTTVEDAKAYVEKRIPELAPKAIDRIALDLLYGSAADARKAAYEILDRAGFGKREANVAAGAPIIIVNNGGGGAYQPVWSTAKPAPVIDVTPEDGDA